MTIKKKAELTTQQIVMLIILIVSFIVILFFIFRLDLGKITEKELCRNSVVMRGKSILPEAQGSLNCHRKYLCVTSDKTCEEMTKPELKNIESKEEVYQILADEMADCWWMFGEGEINYVGEDFFSDLYCSICTQVAFDDSLREEIFSGGEIDKKELYLHMEKEKISGSDLTYLEYLYGISDVNEFEEELKAKNIGFNNINLGKQHYILMGIHSEIDVKGWIFTGVVGATVVAGALTFAPIAILPAFAAKIASSAIVTKVISSGIIVKGIGAGAGLLTGITVKGASGNEYLSPTIVEVGSIDYEKLECYAVSNLA